MSLHDALEMLIREAQAVADDHHESRYFRLDQALESARRALGSTDEPGAGPDAVDAARYRWIRDHGYFWSGLFTEVRSDCGLWAHLASRYVNEAFDEAVDKMKQHTDADEAPAVKPATPVHTPEDDFQHFLAYEQLSRQPPDELDRLRLAYYAGAGADAPRPAKSVAEPGAQLTQSSLDGLIAEADKYILPVDVKMGCATFRKGVKVGTMLRGLKSHAERQTAEAYRSPAIVQGADFVLAPAGKANCGCTKDVHGRIHHHPECQAYGNS